MYFASSWIFFYTFYLQAEVSKNLKDMSKMALRYNEQERMLDCERRSLAGLQLQLDQATQSLRKKENEAEVASQQATRLDMQLTLANKEISVLRDECQKLEVHTYILFICVLFWPVIISVPITGPNSADLWFRGRSEKIDLF